MDPIQELMNEHRIIEKVLTALTTAAELDVPLDFYEKALDFIQNFADQCHHGKEEERLFPLLEKRGIPRDGGPIGCMRDEHEIGRSHVGRMRELIAANDRAGLRRETLDYVALLREHIRKEDEVLFPVGRSVLSDQDLEGLRNEFDQVETPGHCHHHYSQVADELLAQVGVPA